MKYFKNKNVKSATGGFLLVFVAAALSLLPLAKASATVNAQLYLGPTAQSVGTGSTVTVTLNMASGGNNVFAWQAYLSYPTNLFSSASVTTSGGSPYTMTAGSDVSSGGTVSLARFATSSHAYDGAVAIITLQSNGNAGSGTIALQHICANNSESTGCTAVVDGSGANVLNSIAGATVTVNAPAANSGGGASAGTSGGGATTTKKTSKTATTAPAAAAVSQTVAKTPSKSTNAGAPDSDEIELVITVRDQGGKPVKSAQVTVNGITAYTDKNGKAVLSGVSSSATQATIKYKGQVKTLDLHLQPASEQSSQTAQVSIKIKKASTVVPISVGVFLLLVFAGVILAISRRKSGPTMHSSSKAPTPKPFDSDAHFVAAPKATPQPEPKPVTPVTHAPLAPPKPQDSKPPAPVTSPVQSFSQPEQHTTATPKSEKERHEARLARQRALEPGTVVHPNELITW